MKKNFFDAIDVKTPCNENWEEMSGNDEVRFCSHCAKNVHDISAMTRAKAEELIQNSNGNLCVRYVKNPNGKIISAPPKLTQIKRRATLAAGVLATSLTLTTLAYSQGEARVIRKNEPQTQSNDAQKTRQTPDFSTISGSVADENGAIIPDAKITLRNAQTGEIRVTNSDFNGFFEFKKVERAIYDLEAKADNFEPLLLKNLDSSSISGVMQNLTLKVDPNIEIVGLLVVESPLECPDDKPAEKIEQKKPLELPINNRNFVKMGLIPAAQSKTKPAEKTAKSKKKKKKN